MISDMLVSCFSINDEFDMNLNMNLIYESKYEF